MTHDPGPDCRRLAALIERDLDGELTPEQRGFTEAHLAACPGCRARRGFQAELRARLDAALSAEDPPRGLGDRMLEVLEREERALEGEPG
jgi:anti-sigma factor RsiW